MSDYVSIKVKKATKKRIDNASKFTGLKVIDVVDDALIFYQYRLLRSLKNSNLKDVFSKYDDAIQIAKEINKKFFENQNNEEVNENE